ncbi:imm11 family protein [Archangium violaceum]|uniref:imm11 family protein n=1 Tax=Archangium violaceum TaxID=83451 RepID=UPI0037C15EDB
MNTQNSYFDFMDDMSTPGRWHLRSPVDARGQRVDPWQFKKGQPLDIEGVIRFPVNPTGIALEFTLASFLIPVVHQRVVALFERLGLQKEVQFIPVEVEGQTEPWFILNVLQIIRCIDDARCEEVLYWLPEDNRPDKLGQYRNVAGLKVDPAKIGEAHIFRPWGWKVVLIVSEHVKRALEQEGITGIKFLEV